MSTAPARKPKPRPKAPKTKLASKSIEKTAPAKVSTSTAKKRPAPKKTAAAAPKAKREPGVSTRPLNDLGFVDGTDSAIIAKALVEGGADRNDVNAAIEEEIAKVNGIMNRNGKEKYVPSMVSGILNRMLATGEWEVEANWQLVRKEKPARRKKTA